MLILAWGQHASPLASPGANRFRGFSRNCRPQTDGLGQAGRAAFEDAVVEAVQRAFHLVRTPSLCAFPVFPVFLV